MKAVKFKKEYLTDELDLPDAPHEGVEYGRTVYSNKIVGHGRWSVHHEMVFSVDGGNNVGEAYRVRYSVGATESQHERPWEHEDEVEATVMRQVEKVIKVWEPVE